MAPKSKKFTDRYIVTLKPKAQRFEVPEPTRSGLAIRVAPSGRKSWAYRYHFEGRVRRLQLGVYPAVSLSDARVALAEAQRAKDKGRDPAAEAQQKKRANVEAATVGELVREYLGGHAVKKKSGEEDRRLLNKDVLPKWKRRKAASVNRRDVVALLNGIRDRGAPVVANRVQSLLSKLFNFGISEGLVDMNPVTGIDKRGVERQRERTLSENEIVVLWRGLPGTDMTNATQLALKFQLVTAQRKSEIVSLRRRHIDKEKAIWTQPASTNKAGRTHVVPLSELALELLGEIEALGGEDYLFPAGRGRSKMPHLRGDSVGQGLRNNIVDPEAEGEPGEGKIIIAHVTPHDLRRTAATEMGGLGIARFIRDRILNHADSSVGSVYDQHSYLDEKRHALDAWSAELRRILGALIASNVVPLKKESSDG